MDYEKKYNEALYWMKSLYPGLHGVTKEEAETYFPELKESEDEQHRKWILEYLYDGLRKSDEQFKGQFKCAIAWLEKLKVFAEHGDGLYYFGNNGFTYVDNPEQEPFDYENATIIQKDFAPKKGGEHDTEV